jgi:hypothetical protein
MDISSIVLLVISSAISFGLGRWWKKSRDKRRERLTVEKQAQVALNRLAEEPSKNKAKRKRQLQELDKASRKFPL